MEINQAGLAGTIHVNLNSEVVGLQESDKIDFLEKLHALMEGHGVVKIDVAFNPFSIGVFVGKK